MRRYPTSPPVEDPEAVRRAEQDAARQGGPQAAEPGRAAAPDAHGYAHHHSGRRAAGHGGGSLDASTDGADYAVEPGAAFSGAGQGHAFQASQGREADEELEGRTGPYVRSGLAGRDARHGDATRTRPETDSTQHDGPAQADAGHDDSPGRQTPPPAAPNK